MNKKLLLSILFISFFSIAQNENFDDITNLNGWTMDNQSTPVGDTNWIQGSPLFFIAHEGADDAYISANIQNTGNNGTICNFLILPDTASGTLSFWTRSKPSQGTAIVYADRL